MIYYDIIYIFTLLRFRALVGSPAVDPEPRPARVPVPPPGRLRLLLDRPCDGLTGRPPSSHPDLLGLLSVLVDHAGPSLAGHLGRPDFAGYGAAAEQRR